MSMIIVQWYNHLSGLTIVMAIRYSLPFDRHDWIVDSNGTEVRYVIDFYKGSAEKAIQEHKTTSSKSKTPPPLIAMHLDVRPAVDSPSTALLRLRIFFWRMLGVNPFSFNSRNNGK